MRAGQSNGRRHAAAQLSGARWVTGLGRAAPIIGAVSSPETAVARGGALVARVRRGVRHPANWLQLARFSAVGATGYVVNLATFTVCLKQFGLDYRLAATAAFLVAVTSNFVWNRRWTFAPSPRARHMQALRFFAVSASAFAFSVGLLQLLVEGGLPHVLAQALSVAAAMPVTFAGNKLWTFA
jgi:putative flippase GtrA